MDSNDGHPSPSSTTATLQTDGTVPQRPSLPRVDVRDRVASVSAGEAGAPFEHRYVKGELLGSGGMGDIYLCRDRSIGRDVAVKVCRDAADSRELELRFFREARVQGQLEHPAVVPVYDMGVLQDGRAYFSMKRIAGRDLRTVLAERRRADERALPHRLLGALARVCLVVHYAHECGVVHRDLKPANIMLGDFDEVYVLDWGIARIAAEKDDHTPSGVSIAAVDLTATGSSIGTPGYMAPEQAGGEPATAHSDIYALGAILFELLARERLHPGKDAITRILSTKAGTDVARRLSEVDPPVPPELARACVRATSQAPEERFASALEVYEALQRFLEGERDTELRHRSAIAHATRAATSAERAIGSGSLQSRKSALADAGRALALDPDNAEAIHTLTRLVSHPPQHLPSEVREKIEHAEYAAIRSAERQAAFTHVVGLSLAPFALWMGVREWGLLGLCVVLMVVATAVSAFIAARRRPGRGSILAHLMAVTGAFGMATLILGPYLVVPAMFTAGAMGFAVMPRRLPVWLSAAVLSLPVVVSAVLQSFDLFPLVYSFQGDAIVIHPFMVSFPEVPTQVFLFVAVVANIAVIAWYGRSVADKLDEARQHQFLLSWHLGQLVPASSASQKTTEED